MRKFNWILPQVNQYFRLTRPIFLLGGFLLYRLGVQIAIIEGFVVNWTIYWLGQLVVTSIQLAAQYANEHYDQAVDLINSPQRTWLTGGSGILQIDEIAAGSALNLAKGFTYLSIGLILVFLFISPIPAVIASIALLGSWFYSANPVRLASTGLGEITASVIVCVLVPSFGCVLQTKGQIPILLLQLSPLLFFHVAMLIVFNIPDQPGDAVSGKRTLVVRVGTPAAVWIHLALILGGWVLLLRFFSFQEFTAIYIPNIALSVVYTAVILTYGLERQTQLPHSYATTSALFHFTWMTLVFFFLTVRSRLIL